ncbi:MAG TPA: HAMP domain-containing sensor histidine kinase [Sphingobacteriaceae bacterium]
MPLPFKKVLNFRSDDFWNFLMGDKEDFLFEHRMFNGLCLLSLLFVGYNIVFNFATGLYVSGIISVLLFFGIIALYYLARKRRKLDICIPLAAIFINAGLAVNYFYNAGASGPTLMLFAIISVVLSVISPKKHYAIYTGLNLIVVGGLLLAEYRDPEAIVHYEADWVKFIDLGSTYLVIVLLTLAVIYHLKESYEREKASADEKAAALDALNKEKIKLFSLVSHDLRTPIANIKSYLELMNELELDAGEKLKFERELLGQTIQTQHLLTNLLTWSGRQMQGKKAVISTLNLLNVLGPTIKFFGDLAIAKNISLESAVSPEIYLRADADMLQIVIRNLLSNAIKFTPSSGVVTLTATADQQFCHISVQDTGIGIPAERAGQLFRLESRSTYGTQNEKGVGLGLYLCKEFTRAQNGQIQYEPAPGGGSIFTVSLPAGEPAHFV